MYNFHNHTFRCNHATGKDEDYVIEAIKNGYDTIGFSDHAPYIFPKGHHSGYRIQLNMAQDYADSINTLKIKYADKINIKLGFELEYFPALWDREIEYLKGFKFDYLILGQHYTDNEFEPTALYCGSETNSVAVLDKYISQVILGARTGMFTYVAHPDVINFTGDKEVYMKKMTTMAKRLKDMNLPLEFNFLGFVTNRHYPNMDFWKMVSEVGNDVVIGLDAHKPDAYSDVENLEKAKSILKSIGITPLEKINLIDYNKTRTLI